MPKICFVGTLSAISGCGIYGLRFVPRLNVLPEAPLTVGCGNQSNLSPDCRVWLLTSPLPGIRTRRKHSVLRNCAVTAKTVQPNNYGLVFITEEILRALTIKLTRARARTNARAMARARALARTTDSLVRVRARLRARALVSSRARALVSSRARAKAWECVYV